MCNNNCYIILKEVQFKIKTAISYEHEERTLDFLRNLYLHFYPFFSATVSLDRLMDALVKGDRALILQTLNSSSLAIRGVQDENIDYYVQRLDELKDIKQVKH